jgi:fatty acid desaturase
MHDPSRASKIVISRTTDERDWNETDSQRDPSSELASSGFRIRPDHLKEFYQLDTMRALSAVAGTWSLLALSIAIAIWSRSAIAWIVAAVIVGRSQHALAVLMHDAAHFRLLENRRWNDFVGQWLCAFPIASNLYAYRNVHLRHHKFLLTERDPDLSLSRGYPVTWQSFKRKLLRDATGVSSLVMRGYVTVEKTRARLSLGNLFRRRSAPIVARRVSAACLIGVIFYLGYGPAFICLWLIPLLTVYQVILRIRGVLEHANVDQDDGLRNARTIFSSNPLANFMLNPHHVGYHLEHHLYPAVPHYNLAELHQALAADGRFESALVETSYVHALRGLVTKPEVSARV